MTSLFALFVSIVVSFSASARTQYDKYDKNKVQNQGQQVQLSSEKCLSQSGQILNVMNAQTLEWRAKQPSGFRSRALVSGTVDEVFSDQTGHRHFSIKVGPAATDHIEVIYNQAFGQMPVPKTGESVEACGDYIVATKQNGVYPASPDGAIVHWVHRSTRGGHQDGFVVLDGTVYGFGSGH